MATVTVTRFEVFDPWAEPDENGDRLVHEWLLEGDVTEASVERVVRESVEMIEQAVEEGGFLVGDRREGALREVLRACAHAYALGREDQIADHATGTTDGPPSVRERASGDQNPEIVGEENNRG